MARDLPHNHLMHVPATWTRKYLWLLTRIFVAEFVGSFILVLPSIIIDGKGAYEPLVAGMATGGGLYVAIWIAYPVSGAHINPVMTLASYITKRIHLPHIALYFLAQFAGALMATGTGLAISPFFTKSISNTTNTSVTITAMTVPSPGVTERMALAVEVLISCILVIVYLTTIDEHRPANWALGTGVNMALAMMFTQAGNTIVAESITGGSMNPFRSLAPALINDNFAAQWIYLLGPLIGAAFGVMVHQLIILDRYVEPNGSSRDSQHIA